jgi:hypothetical protein
MTSSCGHRLCLPANYQRCAIYQCQSGSISLEAASAGASAQEAKGTSSWGPARTSGQTTVSCSCPPLAFFLLPLCPAPSPAYPLCLFALDT